MIDLELESEKFARIQLEPYDPDLELTRRIEAMRKKGYSDDEIVQKLREF